MKRLAFSSFFGVAELIFWILSLSGTHEIMNSQEQWDTDGSREARGTVDFPSHISVGQCSLRFNF